MARQRKYLFPAALVLGLAAALAGFSACAEPPLRTIVAARNGFSELRDELRGETWAPDEFRAAEAAMRQAEGELREQQGRMGFRRDYALTLELFRAAQSDLDVARRAAVESRAAAERDARQAVEAAASAVDNARAAVLIAPVGRDGRSEGARLDVLLEQAADRLMDARERLQNEEFREAQTAADGVLEDVAGLVHQAGRSRRGGS
jgi:hypothetical protein